MNLTIKEFTIADFENYMAEANQSYANENIKSGKWSAERALKASNELYNRLLPDGLSTKGYFFWKICLDEKKVGIFWFFRVKEEQSKIFVYDVEIQEQHQNKGIGTKFFKQIQSKLLSMGIRKIALHVFAHNTGAIRFYKRLGFKFTDHNMHFDIPSLED